MELTLAIGAVVLILAVVALVTIVSLAKAKGAAGVTKEADKAFQERRRDADEVLSENVADEIAWLERQVADSSRTTSLSRLRLRELQRRTGSNLGGPVS